MLPHGTSPAQAVARISSKVVCLSTLGGHREDITGAGGNDCQQDSQREVRFGRKFKADHTWHAEFQQSALESVAFWRYRILSFCTLVVCFAWCIIVVFKKGCLLQPLRLLFLWSQVGGSLLVWLASLCTLLLITVVLVLFISFCGILSKHQQKSNLQSFQILSGTPGLVYNYICLEIPVFIIRFVSFLFICFIHGVQRKTSVCSNVSGVLDCQIISRVPDKNGISQARYSRDIPFWSREPSICTGMHENLIWNGTNDILEQEAVLYSIINVIEWILICVYLCGSDKCTCMHLSICLFV